MRQVSGPLNLEVGVERVSVYETPLSSTAAMSLDDLAPPDPRFRFQLEDVLFAPKSYEQKLLLGLRPQIQHREVLRPHVFSDMLDDVLKRLKTFSRKATPGRDRQRFDRASGTLQEFHALTALLRENQHALHRG